MTLHRAEEFDRSFPQCRCGQVAAYECEECGRVFCDLCYEEFEYACPSCGGDEVSKIGRQDAEPSD